MPGLFCGVSDPERARIIAHHFDGLAVTLHGHHHSEDADLWPLVLQRVGVSAAAPVESMQAQHVELADALDSLQTRVREWSAAPTADVAETLAKDAHQLVWLLNAHPSAVEEHLVPLMKRHITAAEAQEVVAKRWSCWGYCRS